MFLLIPIYGAKIVFKMLHCLHMDVPQTPRCDSSRRILIWISYIACQSYDYYNIPKLPRYRINLHCVEMTSGTLDTYCHTTKFSLQEIPVSLILYVYKDVAASAYFSIHIYIEQWHNSICSYTLDIGRKIIDRRTYPRIFEVG